MRNISILFATLFLVSFAQSQTANFWTKKSDFAGLKRERAVSFVVNDVAFVGTGIDTAENVLKDFWKYDQVTDSWSQVADLPGEKRRNAIAFAIGSYGYVGSGINADSSTEPGAAKLSDFYKYDPISNAWQLIAPFPGGGGAGVYFATGFAIDSKGYLCGGKFGPNSYSNQLWEYKPSINQWTQLQNFPGGVRYQLCSFVLGTKGYVGLGTDQDLYRNDFYAFDAATNQWSSISELPASERSAAMTFSIGNRGFVCMGSNGGLLGDLWEYNPTINDWAVRAPYGGTERKGGVGFAVGGKGYVGTGKGYSGKKASFWEYTPHEVLGLDQSDGIAFNVYPNPTSDYVKVSSEETLELEIYSTEGKLIRKQKEELIDLTGLPPGVYRILAFNSKAAFQGQTNVIKL